MELSTLFDRVDLKMTEAAMNTKSGIILTETAAEKPQVAEVVAVGPGGMVDGYDVEMVVEVGDKVIIGKYAGTEVKVGDDKCIIVRQNDILARVED